MYWPWASAAAQASASELRLRQGDVLGLARHRVETPGTPVVLRLHDAFWVAGDEVPDHVAPAQRLAADRAPPVHRRAARSIGCSPSCSTTIRCAGRSWSSRLNGASTEYSARSAAGGNGSAAPARSVMSRYSVGERVSTGDTWPKASPISTRTVAPPVSKHGRADAGVWVKDGAISSSSTGSAAHSCRPWLRRTWPRRSSGVRSLCTMPRPAVIQLMAPGSMRCTTPVESRCSMAPSNR